MAGRRYNRSPQAGMVFGNDESRIAAKSDNVMMEGEPFKGAPFVASSAATRSENTFATPADACGVDGSRQRDVSRVTCSLHHGEKHSINLNAVSQSTLRLDGIRKSGTLTHLSIKPLSLIPAPTHLIAPRYRSPR